jgi:hypothetical protein
VIPVYAATVIEDKAALFVVDRGVARKRSVEILGEVGGALFLRPEQLPVGTVVVSEGQALLENNDHVQAKEDAPPPAMAGQSAAARGAGSGRPR